MCVVRLRRSGKRLAVYDAQHQRDAAVCEVDRSTANASCKNGHDGVDIHQGTAYVLHINTYRDDVHMDMRGIPKISEKDSESDVRAITRATQRIERIAWSSNSGRMMFNERVKDGLEQ